ncbi:MAG: hypothetical protein POG24_03125 [Acidocella sp.]|nr:hypothetical protein [Acidocella sp.]
MAGRITGFLGKLHHAARRAGQHDLADRYDLGLETIYSASLLLMVNERTGEARTRQELRALLDTAEEVIRDLKLWADCQPGR